MKNTLTFEEEIVDRWDCRFMNRAIDLIAWSKDHNTGVGAVIVDGRYIVSEGYNGFPVGVDDGVKERFERPMKYLYTTHAEINAIITAGRHGKNVENCTLYCTKFPCATCAGAIIQAGITRIVTVPLEEGRWNNSHEAALTMFKEVNVRIKYWDMPIDEDSAYKKRLTSR